MDITKFRIKQDSKRSAEIAFIGMLDSFWDLQLHGAFPVLYISIQSTFNVSRELASWPSTILTTAFYLSGMINGMLARKVPFLNLILLKSLTNIACCLLTYTFFSYEAIFFAFLMQGIISCLGIILFTSIINYSFTKLRLTGQTIFFLGARVAMSVHPLLYAFLLGQYGLRGTVLITTALSFNTLVTVFYFAVSFSKLKPAAPSRGSLLKSNEEDGKEKGLSRIMADYVQVLKLPGVYLYSLSIFSYGFVMSSLNSTVLDFALDKDFDYHSSVLLVFLCGTINTVLSPFLGILTDRLKVDKQKCLVFYFGTIGVSLLILPYTNSFSVFCVLMFVSSIGFTQSLPMIRACMAAYIGKERFPSALGLAYFLSGLLGFGRPALIGYFRDGKGSYAGFYLIQAMVSILTAMLFLIELCYSTLRVKNKAETSANVIKS